MAACRNTPPKGNQLEVVRQGCAPTLWGGKKCCAPGLCAGHLGPPGFDVRQVVMRQPRMGNCS